MTNSTVVGGQGPIPVTAFDDGVERYQAIEDTDEYPRYTPEQMTEIAGNILLCQRTNGGWAANWDPLRIIDPAEVPELESERGYDDTTFDNHATYPQIDYLAEYYTRYGDERCRTACARALDFTIDAQHDCGGWPHSFPGSRRYRRRITFADDVTSGVLTTLRNVAAGVSPYEFVASAQRERAAEAVSRGEACILKLQVKLAGELAVWGAQYSRSTKPKPTRGRTYEPAALAAESSVSVVRYLMGGSEAPSAAVLDAVESAMDWFERSKIAGIRLEEFPAETIRYRFHTSSSDFRVIQDAAAPPIWARFYDVKTNEPFMANRDGGKVYNLAHVDRERRTGYRWYGYFATELIATEYPAWVARWSPTPTPT